MKTIYEFFLNPGNSFLFNGAGWLTNPTCIRSNNRYCMPCMLVISNRKLHFPTQNEAFISFHFTLHVSSLEYMKLKKCVCFYRYHLGRSPGSMPIRHPHPNRKSETTLRVGRRGRVRPTSAWIRSKYRIDGRRAVQRPIGRLPLLHILRRRLLYLA